MAIDEEKAGHVAALAMIGLTPDEIRSISAELNSALDYFERIREADGEAASSPEEALPSSTPERADEPGESLKTGEALREAPAREGDLFRVPRVIG